MKRVIIDTDPGVDDALALLLALKSEELQVELVTTVAGNVPVELGTRNVFRVFDLLPGKKPAVAQGSARPLKYPLADSGGVHGSDGLGDLDREKYPFSAAPPVAAISGAEAILKLVRENPGQLTLVTLGPLTNLALAILSDPRAMGGLKEVIAMLGAVAVPGNVTLVAEFNAFCDPHAAQVVLEAGLPLTLVGLDVTHQTVLPAEAIQRPGKGRVWQFLQDCTARYLKFHQERNLISGCYLHDPLAVAVAIDPELVKTRELFIQVETEGQVTRGMMVADLRPKPDIPAGVTMARVCLEVHKEAFLELFLSRLQN